jgi:hypothetical protein
MGCRALVVPAPQHSFRLCIDPLAGLLVGLYLYVLLVGSQLSFISHDISQAPAKLRFGPLFVGRHVAVDILQDNPAGITPDIL